MSILLFPGRHLLNTTFQAAYLRQVLQMPLARLDFLDGARPPSSEPLDQVVFAVTSANQQHTRYNPIPFPMRAIGLDRFARSLELALDFAYRIIAVPHYPPTPRFAEFILKEIVEQTEGNLTLAPENCVVLSSTPAVFSLFRALGFAVLPAEHNFPEAPPTPVEVLQQVVHAGEQWQVAPAVRANLALATFDLWRDFPDVPRRVLRLWRDPLLDDEGSLTASRDYATYAFGLGNNEIINVKYDDIKQEIVPGKIVDEGCADGALLARIACGFPDSDLLGIEITGEFIARAQERQRSGQFGGTFVHFHQRNITRPIFEANTIDTTICNSTVHELWSYGNQAETVNTYFAHKYAQTRLGGRLLIRDVVGPDNKDQEVYLRLEHSNGRNDHIFTDFDDPDALAAHLAALSTYARFKRFARDFLAERRAAAGDPAEHAFPYRETVIHGDRCAVLALRYAVEFMSKKDYVDNWESEMHEEFAFWSFDEWKAALAAVGFHILENPNEPGRGSRVYTSPWIVENRWAKKVELYGKEDGRLYPLPYPPTNIILVGEKR